ncbi:MAG: tetratricopeptide repeat protein [Pseudomonadota bacterium]
MLQHLKSIIAGGKTGRAQAALIKGNYKKALKLVNEAMALDPDIFNSPVNYQIKGICHYYLGDKGISKQNLLIAEKRLLPLIDDDETGSIRNELSKVQSYIDNCG